MAIDPSHQDLQRLSHELQTLLHSHFPQIAPIQVFCILLSEKLLILVQHSPDPASNPSAVFQVLKTEIQQNPPALIRDWLANLQAALIELYLRFAGQAEVYASDTLDIQRAIVPVEQAADAAADEAAIVPGNSAEMAPAGALAVREPVESDQLIEFNADVAISKRRFGLPIAMPTVAASLLGLVAIAGGIYALTRPCVIGACSQILEAEMLNASAAEKIESPQSAQDVVDAYDQWVEASYLLERIPPWSSHYREARSLQGLYDSKMSVLSSIVQAQRQAYAAAVDSQNPPHPIEVWRSIRLQWQEAIELLKTVPKASTVYPLAQRKLAEYSGNLQAIDSRIAIEREAQSKIQSAREAAAIATARQGIANSLEGWRQTQSTWQTAVTLLQQVPSNTMSHAEAQQLLALYQSNLAAARDRSQQEAIAQTAYEQALQLAAQATQHEQENQWSQAVIAWRDALNNAQQVPTESAYAEQTQPLISSYSQALKSAQEAQGLAIARQSAETELAQVCSGTMCTYTVVNDQLQVQVLPEYEAAIGQASFPFPTTGTVGANAAIPSTFNDLLRTVANVGQKTKTRIAVYNADGSLFGTYMPEHNGYVPPTDANTPEPFRIQ